MTSASELPRCLTPTTEQAAQEAAGLRTGAAGAAGGKTGRPRERLRPAAGPGGPGKTAEQDKTAKQTREELEKARCEARQRKAQREARQHEEQREAEREGQREIQRRQREAEQDKPDGPATPAEQLDALAAALRSGRFVLMTDVAAGNPSSLRPGVPDVARDVWADFFNWAAPIAEAVPRLPPLPERGEDAKANLLNARSWVLRATKALAAKGAPAKPEYLAVKEVLKGWHVARSTLHRWRDAGKIKSYRPTDAPPNAPHQYDAADLDRLCPRRKCPPSPSSP